MGDGWVMGDDRLIVPTLQRGNAVQDAPASRTKRHAWEEKRLPILEPNKPHFLADTVVEPLPAFSRPDSMRILPVCRRHWHASNGLRLPGYAIGDGSRVPGSIPTLERSSLHTSRSGKPPPPSRGRLGGGWGRTTQAKINILHCCLRLPPHPHPSPPLEGEGTPCSIFSACNQMIEKMCVTMSAGAWERSNLHSF